MTKMRPQLYGALNTPAVAVIGVWDPVLPAHAHLFQQLATSAYLGGMSSLVVIIDPDPRQILWGSAAQPVYDELHTRVELITQAGVDAILHLHFTKRDLKIPPAKFLDQLNQYVRLGELWLGSEQTLGNGPEGTPAGIRKIAAEKAISVKVIPDLGLRRISYQVRGLLQSGELELASNITGRPPIRSRPLNGLLPFAWATGRYVVRPADTEGQPFTLDIPHLNLSGDLRKLAHAKWPDNRIRQIAFVSGPKDKVSSLLSDLSDSTGKFLQPIRSIVDSGASLYDRLTGPFSPSPDAAHEVQSQAALLKWCETSANGDWVAFEQRLSHEDHTTSSILPFLGPVQLREGASLPRWSKFLESYLQLPNCGSSDIRPINWLADGAELSPFEELMVPFVEIGRREIEEGVGKSTSQLTEAAWAILGRGLLQQIMTLSLKTLTLELQVFQARTRSALDRLLGGNSVQATEELYRDFVDYLSGDKLLQVFARYPVLARLICQSVDQWVSFVSEFLLRLERDSPDMETAFRDGERLGTVVQVVCNVSDNHNGGRSVLLLTFSSGLKLVYKPKDLQLEHKFALFQHWINRETSTDAFSPLKILPRYEYGWAEFAPHRPSASQEEVPQYFTRCGMLLCLVYLLEGTDCHYENLVACGSHPRLVDLETLMHHHFQSSQDLKSPSARAVAEQRMWKSVLRTHFLPNWVVGKDGSSRDLGGLGGGYDLPENPATPPLGGRLTHDDPQAGHPKGQPLSANVVFTPDGKTYHPRQYVNELIVGFEQMYEFLLSRQQELLSEDGPLNWFANQQVRFVLRPTEAYSALMQRTFAPDFLRSGVHRSLELDALSRAFVQDGVIHSYMPIVRAEHVSLEQLDVPYFTASASCKSLCISHHEHVADFFDAPSYPTVRANIEQMNTEDLELQKQFIRLSFYTEGGNQSAVGSAGTDLTGASSSEQILSADEFVAEAVSLAEYLEATAVRAPDKSATWIALQYHPTARQYQLRSIGYDLYNGASGIALFLAAVARKTGYSASKALATSAIAPIRATLPIAGRRFAKLMGIGGFSGMGSIIYALTCMGWLLEDETLLSDAYSATRTITADLLDGDRRYDVTDGSAGLLLALLTLLETAESTTLSSNKQQALLDLAVLCGDHLVNGRTTSRLGLRTWATLEGQLFSGFAHGASGIAYALARLHAHVGDEKYRTAALEGVAYETSIFFPDEENWPHFETDAGKEEFLTQWCHGAPGVGLARLLILQYVPSLEAELTKDIRTAMRSTLDAGFVAADYLCCGNLGRARILLRAGEQLGDAKLKLQAQTLSSCVVHTARLKPLGMPHSLQVAHPGRNPSFMRGVSGVGYCFLEMADQDCNMPQVLSLNAPVKLRP